MQFQVGNQLRRVHGNAARGNDTPTYRSWQAMKTRCTNPRRRDSAYYGGRGVKFDPWWNSFEAFLQDMGQRPLGTSLDRKDPEGDYTLDNCRWATPREQRLNRRPSTHQPNRDSKGRFA